MIVVVGHGPSILSGLGAVIDSHTVVRLKRGLNNPFCKKRPQHWGTRTDYIFARSPLWMVEGEKTPYLLYGDEYEDEYLDLNPSYPKPSTGVSAVLCVAKRLRPERIGLIGFDRVFDHTGRTCRFDRDENHMTLPHDAVAESKLVFSLGIPIVDLRTHGTVS